MALSVENGMIVETSPQPDMVKQYTPSQVQDFIDSITAQISELETRKTDLESVLAQLP